jgi:hypothetical protein
MEVAATFGSVTHTAWEVEMNAAATFDSVTQIQVWPWDVRCDKLECKSCGKN